MKTYRVRATFDSALSGSCNTPQCDRRGRVYLALQDADVAAMACNEGHALLAAIELVRQSVHGKVRRFRVATFTTRVITRETTLETSDVIAIIDEPKPL